MSDVIEKIDELKLEKKIIELDLDDDFQYFSPEDTFKKLLIIY